MNTFVDSHFFTQYSRGMSLTDEDKISIAQIVQDGLAEGLKPIKKSLKKIEKKLDMTIDHFDRNFNYHHRRLEQVEHKLDIKPPDFLPKVN